MSIENKIVFHLAYMGMGADIYYFLGGGGGQKGCPVLFTTPLGCTHNVTLFRRARGCNYHYRSTFLHFYMTKIYSIVTNVWLRKFIYVLCNRTYVHWTYIWRVKVFYSIIYHEINKWYTHWCIFVVYNMDCRCTCWLGYTLILVR